MVPLLVRSALGTGALPETIWGSDLCSWIGVDTLSEAIIEIGDIGNVGRSVGEDRLVYNLVHPRPASWNGDFLPALQKAGLEFEVMSWDAWMERLRGSERDVEKNPSRKLLRFWEEGTKGEGRREVVFETKAAEEKSNALKTAERVVEGKYMEGLVKAWQLVW